MRWPFGLTAASNSAVVNEPRVADLGQLDPGVGGAAAGLMPDGVGSTGDDDVVAGRGERAEHDLVGHRAGREPEGCFLAKQFGDPILQAVDRRVVTELVVADLGGGHRGAHARRGPGNGVGAEIDRCHRASRPDGRMRGRRAAAAAAREIAQAQPGPEVPVDHELVLDDLELVVDDALPERPVVAGVADLECRVLEAVDVDGLVERRRAVFAISAPVTLS